MRTFVHDPEQPQPGQGELWAPSLLVRWSSWPRSFLENLRDAALAAFRPSPAPDIRSEAFWPDVFVSRRVPIAPFRQSALYHLLAVVALWGYSHTWLSRPQIRPRNPFQGSKVVYYPTSEYLPALEDKADSEPAKIDKKGQPVYARQRIRSVPRRPDNIRQTIVTPPPAILQKEVPLPNIVAWTPVEAPIPLAAATTMRAQLTAPGIASPIPPPPSPLQTQMRMPSLPQPIPIGPPPEAHIASSSHDFEAPSPIPPVPVLHDRSLSDLGISHVNPTVINPHLPVIERSTVPVRSPGNRRVATEDSAQPSMPPSMAASGISTGASTDGRPAIGQLIALSTKPTLPRGPVQAQGNRRGSFAASPEGKPDASGTPDVQDGDMNADAVGSRTSSGVRTPVPGLTVEKPPVEMAAVRAPRVAAPSHSIFAQTLARAANIPRTPQPAPVARPEPKIEDLGAGPKKYYSMTLNMPNLSSLGGTWIIRFAELKESQDQSTLTAPVATMKVDPAYPSELMRKGVEGVVTLYAIIRADGAVSAVRVLRGVDNRLDASARAALQKWHFRPGTKNGAAVDLEAVIQIPFQARQRF